MVPVEKNLRHLNDQVGAARLELGEVGQRQVAEPFERRGDRVVHKDHLDPIVRVGVDHLVHGAADETVADDANLRAQESSERWERVGRREELDG